MKPMLRVFVSGFANFTNTDVSARFPVDGGFATLGAVKSQTRMPLSVWPSAMT
jgi:hypothetical protein